MLMCLQAAAALAALSVAEPSGAAHLLSSALSRLQQAVGALVEATATSAPDRSRPALPSTPRGVGSLKLKPGAQLQVWATLFAPGMPCAREPLFTVSPSLQASQLTAHPHGAAGMNAVHGWALGTAALLAASVRLPLGVPAALATSALQLAATLIMIPRSQQVSLGSLGRPVLGGLCNMCFVLSNYLNIYAALRCSAGLCRVTGA